MQIPKAPKDTDNLTEFFMLLGSLLVKAARKMLVKLTPGNDCREETSSLSHDN